MNAHEAKVAADRIQTGAREVKIGRIPVWAKRDIRRAAIRMGLRDRDPASILLNDKTREFDVPHNRLFDHFGSSFIVRDGEKTPTLVAEPYPYEGLTGAALRFAAWIGCNVIFGEPTWWFPGRTKRVEFVPKVTP